MNVHAQNRKVSTIKGQTLLALMWGVILVICSSVAAPVFAQEVELRKQEDTTRVITIVLDEPADRVRVFSKNDRQYQELIGNVRLRHDSTFMRMDSSIIDDNNQVEAYGNIVIQELDSTYIFSDTLWYDGNIQVAELLGDVVLEKGDQKLFSDHLIYDLSTRIATYDQKSYMIDNELQLSSLTGIFYVDENRVRFVDSVLVVSDTFNLKADSLAFFTDEYLVQFIGPTVMYNDSSRIYTERGFYRINEEEALFHQNAQFLTKNTLGRADSIFYYGQQSRYDLIGNAYVEKEGETAIAQKIIYHEDEGVLYLYRDAVVEGKDIFATGDSLVYDTGTNAVRAKGRSTVKRKDFDLTSDFMDYNDDLQQGYASGDVIWVDSSGMKKIYSDSLEFMGEGQMAKALSLHRRPMFEWSDEKNDTMFLISDTLLTYQTVTSVKDSAGVEIASDTTQDFTAFFNVSILRHDVTGRADSLAYHEKDSMIVLFGEPILWMDTTQLSGDTIFINIVEGAIHDVLIRGNAFIITSPDSVFFNQIKGRDIKAYFEDGKLVRTDVEGNAESIYFPLDEENAYIGMNKIVCSKIEMYFEENNVTGIAFLDKPTGDLFSMNEVNEENSILKGYKNLSHLRPIDVESERKIPVKALTIPEL